MKAQKNLEVFFMNKYDYLIVGAGLFGSVFAYEATKAGKKCLVIDKRSHIGGNIYTKKVQGINIHYYGAHIFHTKNREIWDYINQFATFNHYVNSPIAIYKNEVYNLPFNMNTFSKLWNIKTPNEAKKIIDKQIKEAKIKNPKNLEEQALCLVGKDIYHKLIKEYTEKQWGRKCSELPAFIIKRIPLRFKYDNNYFNDPYQGIPIGGYTKIIEKMLEKTNILLETSFNDVIEFMVKKNVSSFKKIIYTGTIDEYFNYKLGKLKYRSLNFEHRLIENENFQGNAVCNYTSNDVSFTRIIEHKHFEFLNTPTTVITREYPKEWKPGDEPYYPINDDENNKLYKKYLDLAKKEKNVFFKGRLGEYKYYDMDKVIENALLFAKEELK